MSLTSHATIVITTANGCSACRLYHQGLDRFGNKIPGVTMRDKLIAELGKMRGISVVEVDLSTMASNVASKEAEIYHPKLYQYLRWFPTISLFNSSFNDRSANLEGSIYASQIDPSTGTLVPAGGTNMLDSKLVINWINQELVKNPIFNSDQIAAKPVRSTLIGSLPIPTASSHRADSGKLHFVIDGPTTDDEEEEDEDLDIVGY